MRKKPPTLFEAIQIFLGPIMAEACRIVEEGDAEADCTVSFYGYDVKMKLGDLQALDRAFAAEFRRKEARDEAKFKKDDLIARMKSGKAMA